MPAMPNRRIRLSLLVVAALSLLLTACRAEANVIVDIAGDQSAIVTVEFGLDEELQSLLDSFAGDGGIEDLGVIPEGAGEIQQRQVDDMTFYYSEQVVEDVANLPDLLSDFEASEVDFERLVIDVEEDSGRFEAQVNVPSFADATQGLPIGGFTEDAITSNLFLRMPGTPDPEQTNADIIAPDGTMQWQLPLDGGTLDVVAVTTGDSSGGIPWAMVIPVLLGLAAIAVIAVFNRRRDRVAEDALSNVEAPPAPEAINPVGD